MVSSLLSSADLTSPIPENTRRLAEKVIIRREYVDTEVRDNGIRRREKKGVCLLLVKDRREGKGLLSHSKQGENMQTMNTKRCWMDTTALFSPFDHLQD